LIFEKILFPTDFSTVANKTINYVKKLKEAGTKKVVVLHVIDKRVIDAIAKYEVIRSKDHHNKSLGTMEKEIIEDRQKELEKIVVVLENHGFEVTSIMKSGTPVKQILKTEEEQDVSAIVIGSHGKSSKVEEFFMGLVSERVIRRSKKPVLVVK
jgi:nucleotide-binding universal stress UspA family protein